MLLCMDLFSGHKEQFVHLGRVMFHMGASPFSVSFSFFVYLLQL